ncbi:hypothetical protein K1719_000822 [Acacia pycnantha]|nr:hypothetical protein K1719_000822 [Acacia pycnantha]
MSNALVPTLSSRLQYGNNEILLENFTACMQMEDLMSQFHNNGLYKEPTMMPTQSQSLSFVQQGRLYGPSSNRDISKQLPTKSPSDEPPYDVARGNVRKRPFDAFGHNIEAITNLKAKCHETSTDTSHKIPRNNNLHPPVRRNQKLSDKITTLQKLVSPFGKTDTSSVLHEASLYIKLLQEQIWNLCQMLNSSYNKTIPVHHHKQMCYGERRVSLRSRGLCLVEISSVDQKVITMEDQIRPNAVSRRFD